MEKDIDRETTRERQARVVKAGGNWEEYVKLYLIEKLQNTGIKISKGSEIEPNSILWKKLAIPLKMSLIKEYEWGDIDLVASVNEMPIVIISCKLSLHGRFTETLFYSLLFRVTSKIKVVLATPDAGRGQNKWVSEWGTSDKPTKDRLLAESYLDGVYVENLKEFCKGIKDGEGTVLGGIVKPLYQLPKDIVKWGEEISQLISKEKNKPKLKNFF